MPAHLILKYKFLKAHALIEIGELDAAFKCYEDIMKKTKIKYPTYYANALSGLGSVNCHKNEYEEGLNCMLSALLTLEQLPDSRDKEISIAFTCNNISHIFISVQDYDSAYEYAQRAIMIYQHYNAVEHYANCYYTLMIIYSRIGQIPEAQSSALQAIDYAKNADRSIYPHIEAAIQGNLQFLQNTLDNGYYGDALRLGYKILDRNINHKLRNNLTSNMVHLYSQLADNNKALEYSQKNVKDCRKKYGNNSLETANAYIDLADCWCLFCNEDEPYPDAGLQALKYAHRARNIFKKNPRTSFEQIANVNLCIASIYILNCEYEKALEYIHQADHIIRMYHENSNAFVIHFFPMYVNIYLNQKKYQKALTYSEQTIKIKKAIAKSDEPIQPAYYYSTIILAFLCDSNSTIEYVKELLSALKNVSKGMLEIPQERLRLGYLRHIKNYIDLCYSIIFVNQSEFDAKALYDFTLKTNNIDSDINYNYAIAYRSANNKEIASLKREIDELKIKKETLILERNTDKSLVQEIDKKIEFGEIELIKKNDRIQKENPFRNIDAEVVQHALKTGETLLEYGRFTWYADKKNIEKRSFKDHYYAYAITNKTILLKDLGECEDIDATVSDMIKQIEYEEDIYKNLDIIYEKLFAPFDTLIQSASLLYIVPDSTLYKFPFELLSDYRSTPGKSPCTFIYLSSGRELLRKISVPSMNGISILANPQYDLDTESEKAEKCTDTCKESPNYLRELQTYIKPENLLPLPFTKIEADEIVSLFKENHHITEGIQATKYAILKEENTDILHISTHGFAYELPENLDPFLPFINNPDRSTLLYNADNPLQRCGLLFAGASNWLRGEDLSKIYGNGILSGTDIISMDLSKYKLVVLSACKTGLGDTQSGEGIKGLRHAFELAGAGSLICTLWSVDDFVSSILMKKFYEELINTPKIFPAEALARAKRFIKNITIKQLYEYEWDRLLNNMIDKLFDDGMENYAYKLQDILDSPADEKPFAHPRYWAGFIVQGRCI